MADPLALVHTAQRSLGLRLDGATGHRTLPALAGSGRVGRQRVEPAVDLGPARLDPVPGVTIAQAHGRDSVSAAGHPTLQQGGVGELGRRRRSEFLQRRPSAAAPASFMAQAQALAMGRTAAAIHHAGRTAEHRVSGVEGQHVSPELQAHRGHQLSQQAARNLVLPGLRGIGLHGDAHQLSCPSKIVAVTLIVTSPRTPRASK